LADLAPRSKLPSPEKREWLNGCAAPPMPPNTDPTPAETNMRLAQEFFARQLELSKGHVNQEMADRFKEALDHYFVREVALSFCIDAKPPGPAVSGTFEKCINAYVEFLRGFVVDEAINLGITAEGEEGEVITVTQANASHLLYGPHQGCDNQIGDAIPGTLVVQKNITHCVKFVISPGDKPKLIYWKIECDMEPIVAARKVVSDLEEAERERLRQVELARKKAEQERMEAEEEARRIEEERKAAEAAEAKRIADEAAKAEEERIAAEAAAAKEAEEAAKKAEKERKAKEKEEAAAAAAAEKAAAEKAAAAEAAAPKGKEKTKSKKQKGAGKPP